MTTLHASGRDIRQLSPAGAKRIGSRVLEVVRHLRRHPEMGRESLVPGMRELVVTQTELIVLYVVENEAVVVLGVVSGRQDR